jgi:L-ascorbate metabolism protein UlaG (beta-lactamase superfamily)
MKISLRCGLVFTAFLLTAVGSAAQELPSGDQLATDKGPLAVHPIEHATMALEWNDRTILVDPVGDPGSFKDATSPDLILITDIHGDHLSIETVRAVSTDETRIIASAAVAAEFPEDDRKAVTVLANGESVDWEGTKIEAIAAYNLSPDRQRFHPKGRGNGYVLTLGGKRVYISGDTEDVPEMRNLENIEAAFICMNLPYTMDVDSAADAVLEFKPKIVFPYHFRGKGGMSDIDRFRTLVGENEAIEVRLLKWY